MIGLFVLLRPPQLSCQWHQSSTFDSLGHGLIFLRSQRLSFGFLDSDWRSSEVIMSRYFKGSTLTLKEISYALNASCIEHVGEHWYL